MTPYMITRPWLSTLILVYLALQLVVWVEEATGLSWLARIVGFTLAIPIGLYLWYWRAPRI